jgi:argininosuccinate synthase
MVKIVLAYSGGLDTSVILSWLMETYKCPIIAYAADLGQGDDMDKVKEKAIRTGAEQAIVEDLKEPFVQDFVRVSPWNFSGKASHRHEASGRGKKTGRGCGESRCHGKRE